MITAKYNQIPLTKPAMTYIIMPQIVCKFIFWMIPVSELDCKNLILRSVIHRQPEDYTLEIHILR